MGWVQGILSLSGATYASTIFEIAGNFEIVGYSFECLSTPGLILIISYGWKDVHLRVKQTIQAKKFNNFPQNLRWNEKM